MNFSSPAQLRPDGYLFEDFDYIEEPEAAAALKIAPQTLVKYRKRRSRPGVLDRRPPGDLHPRQFADMA